MWGLMLSGIEQRLQQRLGASYVEAGDECLRCLRTQELWLEIGLALQESCDSAPAANGVKALEVELRRRVFTPALREALEADLQSGVYPERVQASVRRFIVGSGGPLTLGQSVGLLNSLAELRQHFPEELAASRVGACLRQLRQGYRLLDWRFVGNLRRLVDRYRNPGAHHFLSYREALECSQLLLGDEADGLLPFLLFASTPRRQPARPLAWNSQPGAHLASEKNIGQQA